MQGTPQELRPPTGPIAGARGFGLFPLFLLQPILNRVVRRIAALHPELFVRLGPWTSAGFLIDPVNLPFALFLRPDPSAPVLRAVPRHDPPAHDAAIAGRFLDLLRLVDGAEDGDALFFSRELMITGNTEAVVCLRNALDDVEGSIAQDAADLFGRPGRKVLDLLRKRSAQPGHKGEARWQVPN